MNQQRFVCCVGLALLLALAGQVRASDVIDGSYPSLGALKRGTGNKIETGTSNTLHAVWATEWAINYAMSTDGDQWNPTEQLNDGWFEVDMPSIAMAGSTAVVVWWENNGTPLGTIYYAYKPLGGAWTASQLVLSGTEPAIAAYKNTVYVTWSTGSSIQYASFPYDQPYLAVTELVQSTSAGCANKRLTRPSITVVRSSTCAGVPKIGYLFAQSSSTAAGCAVTNASVVPRVESLNAGVWTDVFVGTSTAPAPGTAEGVALSLNAHLIGGDLYLGWSDEVAGVGRTMLVHGKNATFEAPVALVSEKRHVHVKPSRAKYAQPGEFRVAWADDGIFDAAAQHRRGTWVSGSSVTWLGGGGTVPSNGPSRFPQAHPWRIATPLLTKGIDLYFEEDPSSPWINEQVATNFWSSQLTFAPGPVPLLTACLERKIVLVGMNVGGLEGTAVDFADFGTLTRISDTEATITTHDKKTVNLTWTGGRLERHWDEGFVVTAPRKNLVITSRDTSFEVVDEGFPAEYQGR